MSQPTPAGWYPDPADPSRTRWWDGAQWTEHTGTAAGVAPAAPATPAAPAAPAAPRYGEYAPSGQAGSAAPSYASQAWPTAAPAVSAEPSAVGAATDTVWVYLAIVASILPAFLVFFMDFDGYLNIVIRAQTDATAATELVQWLGGIVGISALSYLLIGVSILFSWLDWRELKTRGVSKPFHWAFAFLALVISSAAVYVIGRTVVVRRATGKGLTPLWVWIGLTLLSWIVIGVWVGALIQQALVLLPYA